MSKKLDKKKFFYDSLIKNWIVFAKWIPRSIPKGIMELLSPFNNNLFELIGMGFLFLLLTVMACLVFIGLPLVLLLDFPYIVAPIYIVLAIILSFLVSANKYYKDEDYVLPDTLHTSPSVTENSDEEIEEKIGEVLGNQIETLRMKVEFWKIRYEKEKVKNKEIEIKRERIKNSTNGSIRTLRRDNE